MKARDGGQPGQVPNNLESDLDDSPQGDAARDAAHDAGHDAAPKSAGEHGTNQEEELDALILNRGIELKQLQAERAELRYTRLHNLVHRLPKDELRILARIIEELL